MSFHHSAQDEGRSSESSAAMADALVTLPFRVRRRPTPRRHANTCGSSDLSTGRASYGRRGPARDCFAARDRRRCWVAGRGSPTAQERGARDC